MTNAEMMKKMKSEAYRRNITKKAQQLVEPGVDVQEKISGPLHENAQKIEQAFELIKSLGVSDKTHKFLYYIKDTFPEEYNYLTGTVKTDDDDPEDIESLLESADEEALDAIRKRNKQRR